MAKKQKQEKDYCPLCSGVLEDQTVTHEGRDAEGHLYAFENVPARVCDQCGEIWLPATTVELLDKAMTQAKPKKTIATPVFDLAVR